MSLPLLLDRGGDEAVVAAIRAGRSDGFDVLVARHRPAMLAFARRVLGEHRAAADDVVQEALLRAHRALGRDEREIALRPWLMTLVRNCALDEIRRIRSYPLPAEAAEPRIATGEEQALEQVVSRRTRLRRMVADMATLPVEQRHALVRHAVDGAAHADIAAELGVSAEASRMLVLRARTELTKIEAARDERCETVQAALLRAHRSKRRASAHAHRHLLGCSACRGYRARLKTLDGALRVLDPGPLLVAAVAGAAGAKLAGGGAGAAKTGGGLAAALSAAALGTTVLFSAGDPSPLTVRSPALPGQAVRAGEPLPAGSAIVARRVRLGARETTERFECPPGLLVADLLPPAGGRADVAYAPATVPGRSRVARVRIAGRRAGGATGLAILCRRPVNGSIIARAAAARDAAVCTRRVQLRARPRGRIEATGRLGQPVAVLKRDGRWTRVRTDLGQAGWVPATALCEAAG